MTGGARACYATRMGKTLSSGGEAKMPNYEEIAEGVDIPSPTPPPPEGTPKPNMPEGWYSLEHPRFQGLAEQKGYDQSTARLQAVRYTHEAMIDQIIAQPDIKQNDLAKIFGKSVPWISRIIGSDSFQAALAKRREELSDPYLVASIEERFKGVVHQSLEIIAEKLEQTKNVDLALKSLDVGVKAMGYGARNAGQTNNTQFVIQLPPKAVNSADWADEHNPMKRIENNG